MPFFTKQEIIQRLQEKRAELGEDAARADLHLALIIAGSALFEKRLRSGEDYGFHLLHVGMENTHSGTKVIIGILHDVVEDSDWTVADLERVGFSERIVRGVDAMTRRDGELYFDFVERCSLNPDALDKKIEDLSHNMDASRVEAFMTASDVERVNKYVIARAYLLEVKKGIILPGRPVDAFVRSRKNLFENPLSLDLLARHCGREQLRLETIEAAKPFFRPPVIS